MGLNLIGQKYGRLTVINQAPHKKGDPRGYYWICICDCGKDNVIVRGNLLRTNGTKSCGCLKKTVNVERLKKLKGKKNPNYRHGISQIFSLSYNSWCSMKSRCYTPSTPSYPEYGGRGIKVCDRWIGEDGYLNFVADMGERPSKAITLDRIDANRNYEPSNCRWADKKIQSNNKRHRGKDTDNHQREVTSRNSIRRTNGTN